MKIAILKILISQLVNKVYVQIGHVLHKLYLRKRQDGAHLYGNELEMSARLLKLRGIWQYFMSALNHQILSKVVWVIAIF